ncbi:hypothetical protein QE152_g28418 [Popillia japonica]|uniref:Uncharacterized protein n=1 Tax=Popillia japonica TaxID=7064 RepID=A0AAW1JK53_POPJA
MSSPDSENELSNIPPNIIQLAANTTKNLLPEKSNERYEKVYQQWTGVQQTIIEEIVVNSTYGIHYQNLHTNANVVPLLEFKYITEEDLNAIVKSIRKNYSVDDVDMQILLAGGITVRNLLTTSNPKSFEENTVPNSWKVSTVTPVPKVINTNKVEE